MKLSAFLNGYTILWSIPFALFAFLAYLSFFPLKPALDAELVTVKGTLLRAETEIGLRRTQSLVVTLQGDDVQMRSRLVYPSKFKFGLRTPDVLKKGEPVTFVLNKSEMERLPRTDSNGRQWREFVGMSTSSAVHLTPEDFEQGHLENRNLGKILGPIMCLLCVFIIIMGYNLERKRRQKAQQA